MGTSTMGTSPHGHLHHGHQPLWAAVPRVSPRRGGDAERPGTRHEEKVFAGALERPRGC